ncbi:lia operon protein LiaI [Gracilibacillus ureilyticus]|uniref:Lia operon protein LiaI n=1 Tax=Gracilibacillus ureilyticus TaxID=531814 RepID=A0A1H9SXV4_9BACI|nr:phospholipid carrier-dependent glycosyltransferase [Gracilibacillus ureilyticus]SER89624.1 lia operon protein LiaI [Gracilibacillus ureilyticus]
MKTFLLICLTVIAGITLLANVGPMIMLVISVAIAYYGVKKFILAETTGSRVWWAIVILFGISISLSNLPALVGVAALVVLYYTYKKWKQEKESNYYTQSELTWEKL